MPRNRSRPLATAAWTSLEWPTITNSATFDGLDRVLADDRHRSPPTETPSCVEVVVDRIPGERNGISVHARATHLDRYAVGVNKVKGMIGHYLDLGMCIATASNNLRQ
jgi:hypothetical protein